MKPMSNTEFVELVEPLFCDVCKHISFDRLVAERKIKLRAFKDLHSTSSRCILCKLIFKTMKRLIVECSVPEVEIDNYIAELGPSEISLSLPLLPDEQKAENDRLIITVGPPSIVIDGWHPFLESGNSLRLFHSQGTPSINDAHVPVGRCIEPTANSDNIIKQIIAWLDKCTRSHEKCRKPSRARGAHFKEALPEFPARVLDIGLSKCSNKNSLQLVEDFRGPYVALSHCWGTARHIVTEKKNIEVHKKSLALELLPKTFQDAVEFTRAIGVRYLWIDSLCIIQDDLNDWKREAAKMANVYQNAYCTIAATGSKGDQDGIFIPRVKQDVCSLEYIAANTTITATYIEDDVAAMKELHTSPLSTRAWTLQERLLSRRTVHFTESRVIWECRSRFETEDLLVLGPEDFGSILTQSLFEFSTTRSKWISVMEAVKQESITSPPSKQPNVFATFQFSDLALLKFSTLWYCLIEDYSRRGLTRGSDKLIALSGLAQQAQEQTGLQYCAGIWLDTIHTNLCWVVREEELGSRTPDYRAPTWSWASMDTAVVPIASYSGFGANAKHKIRSEIELINSDLSFAKNGQLSSAEIVLNGRLRSAVLIAVGGARAETVFKITENVQSRGSGAVKWSEILLDRPLRQSKSQEFMIDTMCLGEVVQEIQPSMQYQILHVSTRQWSDSRAIDTCCEILVVEQIEGRDGEYVRVGAGYLNTDSWFDDLPLRWIKIF